MMVSVRLASTAALASGVAHTTASFRAVCLFDLVCIRMCFPIGEFLTYMMDPEADIESGAIRNEVGDL